MFIFLFSYLDVSFFKGIIYIVFINFFRGSRHNSPKSWINK